MRRNYLSGAKNAGKALAEASAPEQSVPPTQKIIVEDPFAIAKGGWGCNPEQSQPTPEELLDFTLGASRGVSWYWNKAQGIIRRSSNAIAILGTNNGSVADSVARIHPDDRDRVRKRLKKAIQEGGQYEDQYRFRGPDGDYIWLNEIGMFYRAADGKVGHALGVMFDITSRKAAEASLLDSEERLKYALNKVKMYVWERDLFSTDVVRIGDPVDVLGDNPKSIEEFIARVHPQDRPEVSRAIHAAINHNKSYNLEFRFQHMRGQEIWLADVGGIVNDGRKDRFVGLCFDITERKELELSLVESEARFRDIVRATSDWIWETNANHQLVYLSEKFASDSLKLVERLIGKNFSVLVDDAESSDVIHLMAQMREQRAFRDCTLALTTPSGEDLIWRFTGQPIYDSEGQFLGYRGTISDVTSEAKARAQVEHLAHHDSLTGLANRTLMQIELEQALERFDKSNEQTAVICIDLDNFKDVNDSFGHRAGDLLLREVAHLLQSVSRRGDTVARFGGDEFVVIVSGQDVATIAESIGRRLHAKARQPFKVDNHTAYIGFSIGVALAPIDGMAPDMLLRKADAALYAAKAQGRGRLCFYEASLETTRQTRKKLEHELRLAIEQNALEVYYQPLIDIRRNRIAGVEALVRWFKPDGSSISPTEFIPIAEQSGQISTLGEWVLRTSCTLWRDIPDVDVAVNVSPLQFRRRGFVDGIDHILRETRFPPHRLELEVTEGIVISDDKAALETFTALKALGVTIALDDFGTGYSSLSYVHNFPFDRLKIDRSFVSDLGHGKRPNAIVYAAVALGQALGLQTTAEGVETSAQFDILRAAGCDIAQGYLFGRPMPFAEIRALCRQQNQLSSLKA